MAQCMSEGHTQVLIALSTYIVHEDLGGTVCGLYRGSEHPSSILRTQLCCACGDLARFKLNTVSVKLNPPPITFLDIRVSGFRRLSI